MDLRIFQYICSINFRLSFKVGLITMSFKISTANVYFYGVNYTKGYIADSMQDVVCNVT